MTEAYKIGVTVAMNNLISSELAKIGNAFMGVNRQAKELHLTLGTISKIGLGIGVVGGIGAMASGIQRAMKLDDTVARAMIALGEPVHWDYLSTAIGKRIRDTIFDVTTSFGVSMSDAQEAALQTLRSLAPLSTAQRSALLPSIMQFAAAESMNKHGTSVAEAAEAGIGLAHQMRAYTPEQIEPLLGAFAKLSMASPQSLSQMSRAMSYYVPLLKSSLGMDATELMAIGTVGSQMGLNTKSGTWLAQMFQAPFMSDLTGKREKSRLNALQELGLVDHGRVVTKDPFEFLKIIAEHSEKLTQEQRLRDFVSAFGQQGARAAAIFSDPVVRKNISAMAAGLQTAQTPAQIQEQLGNDPLVKWQKLQAQLNKDLTELGNIVMPAVLPAIESITGILKYILRIAGGFGKFLGKEAFNIGEFWHNDVQPVGVNVGNAFYGRNSVPPPKQQQQFLGTTVVKIGEREVGRAATKYQVEGMQTMPSSGSTFDSRMHLQPVQ